MARTGSTFGKIRPGNIKEKTLENIKQDESR